MTNSLFTAHIDRDQGMSHKISPEHLLDATDTIIWNAAQTSLNAEPQLNVLHSVSKMLPTFVQRWLWNYNFQTRLILYTHARGRVRTHARTPETVLYTVNMNVQLPLKCKFLDRVSARLIIEAQKTPFISPRKLHVRFTLHKQLRSNKELAPYSSLRLRSSFHTYNHVQGKVR